MRRLVWFVLGFGTAAAVCAYFLSEQMTLWIGLAAALVFAFLLLFRKILRLELFLILAGMILGMFYYTAYDRMRLKTARDADGESLRLNITATDYSFDTGYSYAVDGKIRLNSKKYSVRLFYETDMDFRPGDEISVRCKMQYTSEGGTEEVTYHRGEGIFLLAYEETEPVLEKRSDFSLRYMASHIRNAVTNRISEIFPADTAGFAVALLLGDDSRITFEENMSFQRSGIRHIIAVSGLHISILFAVVYVATGKKRLPSLLLGVPVLFLFAAVAGFSPSIVRACIMQGFMILSLALDRQYDGSTALSISCLVMLIGNPLVITSVSFQLSVGCMIGIFLFYQPIRNRLYKLADFHGKRKQLKGKLYSWFISSVSVSVSVMIFTLPLCAAYFGMVCAMGIVANLLVLWVIAFVFYGIALGCLVSLIWMPLGEMVAWVVSWAIRYVLKVSDLLSRIPGAVAYSGSPYTILWIVLTIGLIALFFFCRKKYAALLAAAISFFYVLSLVATWAEPRLDNFRMTVVDVGQGQCILLQSKDAAYMVDCGGGNPERTAEAALKAMGAQGIRKLDGLILTHFDRDHSNGAEYLMRVVEVDSLYLPDVDPKSDIRYNLVRQEFPIRWVRENTQLTCGVGNIRLIPSKIVKENNESSMCILFQTENCAILITGDRDTAGEARLLEENNIGKVNVLVVGHHGADTSTGAELLESVRPDTAIISVGKDNYYGQPHSGTLQRLSWFGCQIRRTDLEGTIMIRG